MNNKPKLMKLRWVSAAVLLSMYANTGWAFNIDDVAKQAKDLAGKGFEAPKSNLPSQLRDMKLPTISRSSSIMKKRTGTN